MTYKILLSKVKSSEFNSQKSNPDDNLQKSSRQMLDAAHGEAVGAGTGFSPERIHLVLTEPEVARPEVSSRTRGRRIAPTAVADFCQGSRRIGAVARSRRSEQWLE